MMALEVNFCLCPQIVAKIIIMEIALILINFVTTGAHAIIKS